MFDFLYVANIQKELTIFLSVLKPILNPLSKGIGIAVYFSLFTELCLITVSKCRIYLPLHE